MRTLVSCRKLERVQTFGMGFVPSNCEMLLLVWIGSNVNLFLAEKELRKVNIFYCVCTHILSDGPTSDGPSARIQKT